MKHMSGVSKKSVNIVLAQHWKALTEDEKKEYCARCKEVRTQLFWDDSEFLNLIKTCFFQMKRQYNFDIGVLTVSTGAVSRSFDQH